MEVRGVVFLSLIAAVAGNSLLADDLDDLRAANEEMVRAHNELEPGALVALRHPDSVTFVASRKEAVDRHDLSAKEELERSERSFASLEELTITPLETSYRVIGDTGIVWGSQSIERKRKGQPLEVEENRVMRIFSKADAGWLLVASHFSAIPQR